MVSHSHGGDLSTIIGPVIRSVAAKHIGMFYKRSLRRRVYILTRESNSIHASTLQHRCTVKDKPP